MASKEEIDGAPLDNEDEPQKVERRPSLSLSFHGYVFAVIETELAIPNDLSQTSMLKCRALPR
jgi:hypothetical protein